MKKTCAALVALCIVSLNCFAAQKNADLLIVNGIVVTVDGQMTVIENGAVAVKGDSIIDIASSEKIRADYSAPEVIDAAGKIIMPGFVNTHCHAAMTLFRGYADDLKLEEWLNNNIWPLEAKFVSPEMVKLGGKLAMAEMIRSGTTLFNDMYFFENDLAVVCKEAGMRAVLGECLLDFPTPNMKTPKEGLLYTENFIKAWKNDPLITVAVAPHSPYACSPDLLKAAKAAACKYKTLLHIHVSETLTEVDNMIKKKNMTPFEYLNSLGFLGQNIIAAHCVHLSGNDIELVSKNDVAVAHNPSSNLKLASGAAPIPLLQNRNVRIGLGTDGAASNNNQNIFVEMNIAAKLEKMINNDPTVMKADAVVRMATIEGAKALGLGDRTGSLEKGKKADIIIIDLNNPHSTPLYNVYSHLTYSAEGSDVETVIINGKQIMRDGKLLTLNEQEILQKAGEFASRVKTENSRH